MGVGAGAGGGGSRGRGDAGLHIVDYDAVQQKLTQQCKESNYTCLKRKMLQKKGLQCRGFEQSLVKGTKSPRYHGGLVGSKV